MASTLNSTSNTSLPSYEVDPYEHVDYLGHGAYGYVDKVRERRPANNSSAVYARKVVRISSSRDREYLLRSVLNEFNILSRLKHKHVLKVLEVYQWKNCLSIIMSQVAEVNLAEFLQSLDDMDDDMNKNLSKAIMQSWPICLIRALDYLHEMKIKHKDLKPANILILQGQVLVADFGISKDLIDEETTASLGANGEIGTRIYCAPEVLAEDHRRGRSADIYAMGCIYIEIATVILASKGDLQNWSLHRERHRSRLYSRSEPQILQWILYLWSHANLKWYSVPSHQQVIYDSATSINVAFLMLDPNPKTRITARQTMQVLQAAGYVSPKMLDRKACQDCSITSDVPDPNLPIHSVYKLMADINIPVHPEDALKTEAAPNWDAAKRLWLKSHMWW